MFLKPMCCYHHHSARKLRCSSGLVHPALASIKCQVARNTKLASPFATESLMGYCCAQSSSVLPVKRRNACGRAGRTWMEQTFGWCWGFIQREGLCTCFCVPGLTQWHHTWPEPLRRQFGLSDLMALWRVFEAGEVVQPKWEEVRIGFCSICWASGMICVVTCEMKCQKQQQVIFWCHGTNICVKFFFICLTTPVIYRSFK